MTNSAYTKRKIVKEEVPSAVLEKPRSVRVYLPPGYDETMTYPIIYCQDGEQFFNFGRIATHASRLIHESGMEPVVIVGVDVELAHRTAEYSPDGARFDRYCQFFANELVPYVEQHFPVRKQVEDRILAGDSLGGTVSLHLALDHPHRFSKVISMSGAFLDPTRERLREETDLSELDLYMVIGLDETEVKTERGTFDFLQMNRLTRPMLEERGARVRYEEKPGRHIWGFWQDELPDALLYYLGK